MQSDNKKRVAFEECITIRHYEYQKDEEMEDKLGKDWLKTQDLTCREFSLPIEKGGCGGNWQVLQNKLDKLSEPCWKMIGMLRHSLYTCAKRLDDDDEDDWDEWDEWYEECQMSAEDKQTIIHHNETDKNVVFCFQEER